MLYRLIRSGLFRLPPESAHDLTLGLLDRTRLIGLPRVMAGCREDYPTHWLGFDLPNPVGLAAGLDKNGDHMHALAALGFGFIEVGTVTPNPQPGNPKPRMFRLTADQALINRLGFNNKGVDHLVAQLQRRPANLIIGANIGKQKETPVDRAADDYRLCLEKVHGHCDYVTINISSPNTEGLRSIQDTGRLRELLAELTSCRDRLDSGSGQSLPLVVKIAPDWQPQALTASLEVIAEAGVDGLIATNTTISRPELKDLRHRDEGGGLSGKPLKNLADQTLAQAREVLGPDFPIVGLGGIVSGQDAVDKRRLGADVVQIYTGLIYRGPELVGECIREWRQAQARTA